MRNIKIGVLAHWHSVAVFIRGSIPSRTILKTQKRVLDAFLLDTQYYKEWIKDK